MQIRHASHIRRIAVRISAWTGSGILCGRRYTRVGQRSVRDLGSGVDNVSPTGSVISDGFGTLIRHEFRADHRSGLEFDGRVSSWITGHGMTESWSVFRICVVAEIPCEPYVRGWGGNC